MYWQLTQLSAALLRRSAMVIALVAALWPHANHYAVADDQPAEELVAIVNRNNELQALSLASLSRIYRGRQQKWPNGERIVVVDRPALSTIRKDFYATVLEAPPTKRFFQPGSPIPFRTIEIRSERSVISFVRRVPNSISYVYKRSITPEIKVLEVDGLLAKTADSNDTDTASSSDLK